MTYEQYERLWDFLTSEGIPHELELVSLIDGTGTWSIKLPLLTYDLREESK